MGRLTRDPELNYTNSGDPLAVAKYSLAVNRKFKRQGEPDADFINCVAFGKSAEFASNYFRKGQLVSVVGRLQIKSWDDNEGKKRWSTDVAIEEQFFAESKAKSEMGNTSTNTPKPDTNAPNDGFYPIDETIGDDDLPF